jgi:hypothetical protein
MPDSTTTLLPILRIGHATSMRGDGISLRDALKITNYTNHRPNVAAADLLPLIEANPSLVEEWMSYSEDKRTDGGWYLGRDGAVGRVLKPTPERQFDKIERAVAEYVLLELDFWSNLSQVA